MAKEKKYTVREQVEVQHQFDQSEYKSKSEELAQLLAEVSLKKEAVKASAASAKAVIKELESKVSELANQLRLGTEARTVPADVEFDRKGGMKTFRFADGESKGKVIKKVAMTEDDFDRLPITETIKVGSRPDKAKASETAESPPATGAENPVYVGPEPPEGEESGKE